MGPKRRDFSVSSHFVGCSCSFSTITRTLALSGRLSVNAAVAVLWVAWAAATFGIYRLFIGHDLLLRSLIVIAISSTFAIGGVLLSRWYVRPERPPTLAAPVATPAKQPDKEIVEQHESKEKTKVALAPQEARKTEGASPVVVVPNVSIKTDPGLTASDFPSRIISADMMRDLRRHTLSVINPNLIDLQDFVIRFQLPEPVVGGLVIEDRPAGVEIVWNACRVRFNLLGDGASSRPTEGGGTTITTAPSAGSTAGMLGQGEECSAAMDNEHLPSTGVYRLKIARLPAKTAIRVAFLTSIAAEGQRYLEAIRNGPSDGSLVYFGDGKWHYVSGDHVETKRIFVPLRFENGNRTITSEPSSIEVGKYHPSVFQTS